MIPRRRLRVIPRGEYLRGYVDGGGAAVKFVVALRTTSWPPAFLETFSRQAAALVMRWRGWTPPRPGSICLSRCSSESPARSTGMTWPRSPTRRAVAGGRLSGPARRRPVARPSSPAHYRVDPRELKRDVDRQLQQQVHRDYAMVQEFRTAMLRLVSGAAALGPGRRRRACRRPGLVARRPAPDLGAEVGTDLSPYRPSQRPTSTVLARPLAGGQRPGRTGARPRHPQARLRPAARPRGPPGSLLHQGRPPRRLRGAPPAGRQHRRDGQLHRHRAWRRPHLSPTRPAVWTPTRRSSCASSTRCEMQIETTRCRR